MPSAAAHPTRGSRGINAAAEAFNSTLKVEFVHRRRFATRAEARIKVATWIADFYNTHRRHSANAGLSPITFERQLAEARRRPTAQLRAEVA
ncbi:integrase core domain-containing protein [Actinomadura sp. KC345]|uniref:integrase core domain-containing protein n=1 Tax=Actinomadura sp. KC345 TaxID=2530371 RepID=UPI001404B3BA|nr:integrase core domain-containing protein [Actinomadura sp. KC345]